jgi:hypothetical protein
MAFRKLYVDPNSPRTRQTFQDYKTSDFPVAFNSIHLEGSLEHLKIHERIDE